MEEVLSKVVTSILGKDSTSMNAVFLLIIGYLAWKNYVDGKAHREETAAYRESIDKLQQALTDKTGEERHTLLDIIEKYHNSQIGVTQAVVEIKGVLSTMAAMSRGG